MKEEFCFLGIGDCSKQETAETLINKIVTNILMESGEVTVNKQEQTLDFSALKNCNVTIKDSTIKQVQTLDAASFISTLSTAGIQNKIVAAILAAQKKYGFSLTETNQSAKEKIETELQSTVKNKQIIKQFNDPTQVMQFMCDNGGSLVVEKDFVSQFQEATIYSALKGSFYDKILSNVNETVKVQQTSSLFPNLTGIARILVFGLIGLVILLILIVSLIVLVKEV